MPIVKYVSPSVWVWRSGRARAMREWIDLGLALLPFEPEVHRRLGGPRCIYVGHPLLARLDELRDASTRPSAPSGPPLVLVLPGSRSGEVRRHLELFGAAVARLPSAELVLPTMPHLADAIRTQTARWPTPPRIVTETADKWAAFRSARAALAASGTVTLELALGGVPTVVAYRVSLLEEVIARALIKVPSIVLANLVLGENVMPELLQRDATPGVFVGDRRLDAEVAVSSALDFVFVAHWTEFAGWRDHVDALDAVVVEDLSGLHHPRSTRRR